MKMKIAAVCNDNLCGKLLKEAGESLGVSVYYEVQSQQGITNKLSNKTIHESNVILFITDKEVEKIEEIERFIEREYYEVSPEFIKADAKNVISEITMDLN